MEIIDYITAYRYNVYGGATMLLKDYLNKRNMSLYRLSKDTLIPYSTLRDLYTDKTPLSKASGEVIYKISSALDVTMEELLAAYMRDRPSFENFKSETCHKLKRMGANAFIIDLLKSNKIREYYSDQWYAEAFYLLAMLDYLCRENDVPVCTEYDDIRRHKLSEPLFPIGVVVLAEATHENKYYTEAITNSIPEFLKYNIVESEIRNVEYQ